MKNFRKITSAALALLLTLSLAACGSKEPADTTDDSQTGEPAEKYLIGISQYGEHASLDNCRDGFLQGLAQAGLVEGVDFEVELQNAGFDDAIATQIGQGFSAEGVDLMVGIATPSAVACFNAAEDKDIPVIFTAITDPVQAKLDSGNVTGTSDKLPVEAQLDLIRQLQPDAKTIGIIYTTSEPNSVSAIAEYEEKAPEYGFEIDVVGVTAQSEVTQAVDTLLSHGVDCFSNLTDNTVVGVLPAILEKTNEAGIPVYGSEVEQVKIGCVAAAGIDYIQLGIQTGLMAAKVLRGEAACQDIPYE
ncbi:MAG: ABC transporter substrate-binding protein, partial [Oscillospiraceae bacterium]